MDTIFSKKSFKNTEEDRDKLPYTSGIYYFYDENDNLLYLGKAKKFKSRINDHHKNNLMDREGKFYLRIQRAKNTEHERNGQKR
ncbi:MAG: GIY-YIG nuclease family protein [Nitrosopumilaceae archaeon]